MMIALVVTPSTRQVNVSGASTPSPSSTATDSLQRQQQQQQHEQLPTPTTPSFGSFGISAFGTKAASSSSGRAKKSKRPQTSSAITTTLNSGSRSLSLVQALKTTGAFVTAFHSSIEIAEHLASVSDETLGLQAEPKRNLVAFIPLNDITATLSSSSSSFPSSSGNLSLSTVSAEDKREIAVGLALEGLRTLAQDRNGRERNLVIIAYSSNSVSEDLVRRCTAAGADAVFRPPYDPIRLLTRVEAAIANCSNRLNDPSSSHPPLNATSPLPFSSRRDSVNAYFPPHQPNRPSQDNLLTLSDLSAPFANLCSVSTADPWSPRRASVDTGGLALELSRAREEESGRGGAFGQGNGGNGWANELEMESGRNIGGHGDRSTPSSSTGRSSNDGWSDEKMFAELVAEMHEQVRLAIDVKLESEDDISKSPDSATRSKLVHAMSTWSFKPYELTEEELYHCSCLIFEAALSIEGLHELEIDQDQINRFLYSQRAIYHSHNPYHNYRHAMDVVQALYSMLVSLGVAPPLTYLLENDRRLPWKRSQPAGGVQPARAVELLRSQDILILLIAAIGHDGAHPGLSNAFMKNAKSPLSVLYDNKSALENMHCLLVVSLLRKHGLDFLFGADPSRSIDLTHTAPPSATPASPSEASPRSRLPSVQLPSAELSARRSAIVSRWTDFRQLLFGTILATDMSMHFSWISRLTALGETFSAEREAKGGEGGSLPNVLRDDQADGARSESNARGKEVLAEERLLIFQALMKCSDISNPARPHDISEHWSTALLEEWTQQASLETSLGLPVSVVKAADSILQCKGQIAFIDLFTQPLFDVAAIVMPPLAQYATSCALNRKTWFDRLNKLVDPVPLDFPPPPISVPCPLDSRYRSIFPLTLPSAFIAQPSTAPSPGTFFPFGYEPLTGNARERAGQEGGDWMKRGDAPGAIGQKGDLVSSPGSPNGRGTGGFGESRGYGNGGGGSGSALRVCYQSLTSSRKRPSFSGHAG